MINSNTSLIEPQINRFMKIAIAEATRAYDSGEVPVGAVIVNNGKIIGKGFNQREQLNDPTAHAEIIAMTSAANYLNDWRLTNCQLFVTKEPCVMCSGAIVNARIPFVYFGAKDINAGCCGSIYQLCREPRFNHQSVIVGGILERECKQLLSDFFKQKRVKE